MKSPIIRFVLTVICTFALGNAYAEGITIDGIYYNVIKKGKVATVGGAESNIRNAVIRDHITFEGVECDVTSIAAGAFSNKNIQSVTIPNSVTSIGEHAFRYCSNLENVSIPNSVTSIGKEAFYGCIGLKSFVVDSGNQYYCSEDNMLFNKEKTELLYCIASATENYDIPNSVTSIGNYAFCGCRGLTSVTIPNSVTSIGGWAFRDCPGLTSVTIPNSVTSIGEYAFSYCYGLTSVTIGNSVTSIGNDAFYYCM